MARAAVQALAIAALAAACASPFQAGSTNEPLRVELPMPSSAMEPTYRCGPPAPGCTGKTADVLIVQRTHAVEPRNVIAYRAPARARNQCGSGGILVHRVLRIEVAGLFVVGDNRSRSCDSRAFGRVPKANVIGKVVGVRRR
jgi:hypothetical protein